MDQKHVSDLLKMFFSPMLLLFGLAGNIISIAIFRASSMKKHATFRYLTLLSIIDVCSLYIGCTQITLEVYFGVNVRLLSELSCRVHSFLVYFFTHFSSILLACMSIDRTVAIMLKTKKISTPQTAVKIFFILSFIIFAMNLHFLVFTHLYEIDLFDEDNSATISLVEPKVNVSVSANMQSSGSQLNITHLTLKVCYAYLNTNYFSYLATYFPW